MKPTAKQRQQLLSDHGNKCDKCGRSDRRLDAHHTDYSHLPDVVLCKNCHMALHAKMEKVSPEGYYQGYSSVLPEPYNIDPLDHPWRTED